MTVIEGHAAPIMLRAEMTAPTGMCPRCRHSRARIYSHYSRTPQDLPWHTLARSFVSGSRPPGPGSGNTGRPQCGSTAPPGGTASAADVARIAAHQGLPVSADTVIWALRAAPQTGSMGAPRTDSPPTMTQPRPSNGRGASGRRRLPRHRSFCRLNPESHECF